MIYIIEGKRRKDGRGKEIDGEGKTEGKGKEREFLKKR